MAMAIATAMNAERLIEIYDSLYVGLGYVSLDVISLNQ